MAGAGAGSRPWRARTVPPGSGRLEAWIRSMPSACSPISAADDVDDRVDARRPRGSGRRRRRAVDLRLGLGQAAEDGLGARRGPRAAASLRSSSARMSAQAALRLDRLVDQHVELGAGDAVRVLRVDVEPVAAERQLREPGLERLEAAGPASSSAPSSMSPADAAEAVDVEQRRRDGSSARTPARRRAPRGGGLAARLALSAPRAVGLGAWRVGVRVRVVVVVALAHDASRLRRSRTLRAPRRPRTAIRSRSPGRPAPACASACSTASRTSGTVIGRGAALGQRRASTSERHRALVVRARQRDRRDERQQRVQHPRARPCRPTCRTPGGAAGLEAIARALRPAAPPSRRCGRRRPPATGARGRPGAGPASGRRPARRTAGVGRCPRVAADASASTTVARATAAAAFSRWCRPSSGVVRPANAPARPLDRERAPARLTSSSECQRQSRPTTSRTAPRSRGGPLDDGQRLGGCCAEIASRPATEDAGLLGRDRREGRAERAGVVVADRAEGDGQRIQDVGRVVEAADAALDDGDLGCRCSANASSENASPASNVVACPSSGRSASRRSTAARTVAHQPRDGARIDVAAVDAGALAPAHQVRRGHQAGPQPGRAQDRLGAAPRSSPCPWCRRPARCRTARSGPSERSRSARGPRELARMVGHDLGRRADVRREAVQPAQRVLVAPGRRSRNLAAW